MEKIVSDVEKFIRFCATEFGKKILQCEAAYIERELSACRKILDVGCGIGSFEQHLPNLNITGLDISEDMLQEARVRSEKDFVQGNAEQMEFASAIFDAVFTVATLEFLDDPQAAIREIARVTQHQGKLIAMILNPESNYFHKQVAKPGDYFTRMKHRDLHNLIEAITQAYTITKTEYFLGIDGTTVFETSDPRQASMFVIVGTKK
jgi:ubiquinone/menaquinone biosynthesis C-methylase UbiE